jgi:hypothetical protein
MGGWMSKKRRFKGGGRKFIMLWDNVKHSEAYHGLSLAARCALIELIDRYNGINNGMIGLGCRELSEALNCSRDTANRVLHELDDGGLAHPLTAGTWRGKKATEWRLTFHLCNKTGELPILNWKPRSQSDGKDTKVRPEGHSGSESPTTGTQEPNSSMNGNPLSPTTGTHVYGIHSAPEQGNRPQWGATPSGTMPSPEEGLDNFGPRKRKAS